MSAVIKQTIFQIPADTLHGVIGKDFKNELKSELDLELWVGIDLEEKRILSRGDSTPSFMEVWRFRLLSYALRLVNMYGVE